MENTSRPPVMKWYRIYALVMTLMYFVVTALFVVLLFLKPHLGEFGEMPDAFYYGYMAAMILLCLGLFSAFFLSFFLKPKPWSWIYHLVMICIGFGSPCFLPASIPLLIYWIKPEVRLYFGRQ